MRLVKFEDVWLLPSRIVAIFREDCWVHVRTTAVGTPQHVLTESYNTIQAAEARLLEVVGCVNVALGLKDEY